MYLFIIRRILQSIPVLLLVTAVTFFMVHAAPGGPFSQERNVPPEVIKRLNQRYHLDEPMWQQFFSYVGNLLKGDFGPSFKYPSHTVNDLIVAGFPATFELAFYATIFAVLIGLIAGVIASLKPNTIQDYIPMSSAMLGICLPSFVLGPLL